MRAERLAGLLVLLVAAFSLGTDVIPLEPNGQLGSTLQGCTKEDVTKAQGKEAKAKSVLKAASPPASNHPSLVAASDKAAKELKALEDNPACKSFVSSSSLVKNKATQEGAAKKQAAVENNQKKAVQENHEKKTAEMNRARAMKEAKLKEKLKIMQSGGAEVLIKHEMKEEQGEVLKAEAALRKQHNDRHRLALQEMHQVFKKELGVIHKERDKKIGNSQEKAKKYGEVLMRNAREAGQKAYLPPNEQKRGRMEHDDKLVKIKREALNHGMRLAEKIIQKQKDEDKIARDLKKQQEEKADAEFNKLKKESKDPLFLPKLKLMAAKLIDPKNIDRIRKLEKAAAPHNIHDDKKKAIAKKQVQEGKPKQL